MTKALIVVDVQNDFCEGGTLAVAGGSDVALAISNFIDDFGTDYELVVTTQCWHPANWEQLDGFDHFSRTPDYVDTWPPHCMAGTQGAELHPNLRLPSNVRSVRKGRTSSAYSGFEGSEPVTDHTLETLLRTYDVSAVDVCGIATDYCVAATVKDAIDLKFETVMLVDLTAAVHPENTPDVVAMATELGAGIE